MGSITSEKGVLTAESVQIDMFGNQTVTRKYNDRTTGKETIVVDYPDSDIDAEATSYYGLQVSYKSKTGGVTTFYYDGLGRNTTVTDPATGTQTTHYNALGQVDSRQNGAGKVSSYTYEASTGRLATETDTLGNVKHYGYDTLGNLTQVWGSGTYPVQYYYDEYGRKTGMRTWRNDSIDWNSTEWPSPAGGDLTQWHYFPASELLSSVEDANSNVTSYATTVQERILLSA